MKINLGSGTDYREGWVNCDLSGKADAYHDLRQYPWPWDGGSASELLANDIVEHLPAGTLLDFMNEAWRVLEPGGTITVRTPTPEAPFFYHDITHIRPYTMESFTFFDPTTDFGKKNTHLTDRKWEILSNEVVNYNVCVVMRKLA